MNDDDLRDCFAMFALMGLVSHTPYDAVVDVNRHAYQAYNFADAMMEARKPKEDGGITSVAKRTYRRKKDDS